VATGVTSTVVRGNTTNSNADDGIDVDAPGTTIRENVANDNGDLGIEAVPGVVDGGGNRATGNGNPAQCTDVVCT
jgi:parallel beta-helix repeat protein